VSPNPLGALTEGTPPPTRQGRWVRLRLGTASGTAGNVSRPYGTSCATPVGNEQVAQHGGRKVKQKNEGPRGSVWWKSKVPCRTE
jgi:hypothetical protein